MRKRGRQGKEADQESRGGQDPAGWGQEEDEKGHQHREMRGEGGAQLSGSGTDPHIT